MPMRHDPTMGRVILTRESNGATMTAEWSPDRDPSLSAVLDRLGLLDLPDGIDIEVVEPDAPAQEPPPAAEG